MKLDRPILEQYLDGELTPAQVAQVDQALQDDATAARLLAKLQIEQTHRIAALKSYEPDPDEARQLAGIWLDNFAAAPVGKIHPAFIWAKRLSLVAAALLIAAGSFYVGQGTKTAPIATAPSLSGTPFASISYPAPVAPTKVWVVEVQQTDGAVATQEFTSYDEAQKFAKDMSQPAVQVASSTGGVF